VSSARLRAALGLAIAAAALAWPWIALPALFAVLLAAIGASGRLRWLVGLGGGALVTGALLRFTVEIALPNLVGGGLKAAEERAVSRLRAIRWAEAQVRERRLVEGGRPATLGELSGAGPSRPGLPPEVAMLSSTRWTVLEAPPPAGHVYRAEAYLFVVYDRPGGFVAYAWPDVLDRSGRRAFAIDAADHICMTDNSRGYAGVSRFPAPDAALVASAMDCTGGSDGAAWQPWKRKGQRAPRLQR
jgi:hypothetical protein